MPEYLAPGVFVEETSFRSKSIEGVSTSTTAFIGLTRRGPIAGPDSPPELLTSYSDYERLYGGTGDLIYAAGNSALNHLSHGVRGYFNEGGGRLFVARVVPRDANGDPSGAVAASRHLDGAQAVSAVLADGARFEARVRGAGGNGHVGFQEVETPTTVAALATATPGTLVIHRLPPAGNPPVTPPPVLLRRTAADWRDEADAVVASLPDTGTLGVLTINVRLNAPDGGVAAFDGLHYDPAHPGSLAAAISPARAAELDLFAAFTPGTAQGSQLRTAILALPVVDGMRDLPLVGGDTPAPQTSRFRARFPGSGGNGRVVFTESATPIRAEALAQLPRGSIVQRTLDGPPPQRTRFRRTATGWMDEGDALAVIAPIPAGTGRLELLTVNLTLVDADGYATTAGGLHYDSLHPRSLRAMLPEDPASRSDQQSQLYWFDAADAVTGFDIRDGILGLPRAGSSQARVLQLSGGTDGLPGDSSHWDAAFSAILAIDDVSIVASPGYTALPAGLNDAIRLALIGHAETRRSYRIAVLEVPARFSPMEAAEYKGAIDSKYAAIYYPWVTVPNPDFDPNDITSATELNLPPSGYMCGIYARSDTERGVYKAPANKVVRNALRFERQVLTGEQELLNPIGVNCLRYFAGRGHRVWGARTTSSDPEWKYVNIRRYFNYLEHSIDRGTQWAVFEPNGERLWSNVKETITSFLYNEWVSGALLGTTPEQAFFVRCDRGTITQNDLDNGRIICQIGVAVIKPAEFVIFRIGQKTADTK